MLNPVVYTDQVLTDFLRYQLTAYPFADEGLYEQMKRLLSLEESRESPLLRGPFISLSRAFKTGAHVSDLVDEGVLHPGLRSIAPYPTVFGHQEKAMRSIHAGRTTLVSTGTGSGKTESFLYPIISHCLNMRDQGVTHGLVAVVVYPMNALAEDQLGRIRELLAGTGVTFGLYVGNTPEQASQVIGRRLPPGSSREDYRGALAQAREETKSARARPTVIPAEERASRQEIRQRGKQPQILITNVKQLELLLTRGHDAGIFEDARLKYLVFDEAHTFSGAAGAETAVLIRRLRERCGTNERDSVGIATSATIADPERGPEAAKEFASRFFGAALDDITLVGEEYEPDTWKAERAVSDPLPGDSDLQLRNVLEVLTEDDGPGLRRVYQTLTGTRIDANNWRADLFDSLRGNELVFQLSEALATPRSLAELTQELQARVGRPVPEAEVMLWLALGVAARKEERPLLRPVVHVFVRGLRGAVVTLPEVPTAGLELFLAPEDAQSKHEDARAFPVSSCTTCGQHYLKAFLADWRFTGKEPEGGQSITGKRVWPHADEANGGKLLYLIDRLIGAGDEAEEEEEAPGNTVAVFACRYCGSVHEENSSHCLSCTKLHPQGLNVLFAVPTKDDNPDHLSRCLSCGAAGRRQHGRYREPVREMRAVTVSDVFVLAQAMLQRQKGHKRLLVFADNRQDAAFQAGWMQDHARRYRLVSLMHELLPEVGCLGIGDLTNDLDDLFAEDTNLSETLLKEVWEAEQRDTQKFERERRKYLRLQVLGELTLATRRRIGLEPWGRMRVQYSTLTPGLPFIQSWASELGHTPVSLLDGIATLLDSYRRSGQILYDEETLVNTRWWLDGDPEIQRGYIPKPPGVKGLKFTRDPDDNKSYVMQLYSSYMTLARDVALKWGVPNDRAQEFLDGLWNTLKSTGTITPVTLLGARGGVLPGATGVYQIDAANLLLERHRGRYRCTRCRRTSIRKPPNDACPAWRCAGKLTWEPENPDDYDLTRLDEQLDMIRPREHTAQVPVGEREIIERLFKDPESDRANTLVATSTLEMGVDIGGLDAVLMRNVPPLPANYWQRAGRAGRRHRIAINMTYARPASHDRAYFNDPMKLLDGVVEPPKLNLRNEPMIRKHVHAVIIGTLQQLAQPDSPLDSAERQHVHQVLADQIPTHVKHYLFTRDGNVRPSPLSLQPLAHLLSTYEATLLARIKAVFAQGWPEADVELIGDDALTRYLREAVSELETTIGHVWRRLQWAMRQKDRLAAISSQKGTLDPEEKALFDRCDTLIRRLKGFQQRQRSEAQGVDDTNTYAVLAAEGFLPGYGLDTGAISGEFRIPWGRLRDFRLSRPTSVALREYVPGNLIYANGHRFVPRTFQLPPDPPVAFRVDVEKQAVRPIGDTQAVTGLNRKDLLAYPLSDVIMAHSSTISDDEDNRFQMPVAIYALDLDTHNGGTAYNWGGKTAQHLYAARYRMVNVGASNKVAAEELGYPTCTYCGQTRSPYSSKIELENFEKWHAERCGVQPRPLGFYADLTVDSLKLTGFESLSTAYSIAEAIRLGATSVLEMERDDLQLLALTKPNSDEADIALFDPMPGGSGLLQQLTSAWDAVIEAAKVVLDCPAGCDNACVDCLMSFRNAHYHRYLDRNAALDALHRLGADLKILAAIPQKQASPQYEGGPLPANQREARLREILLKAGLPEPETGRRIKLPPPVASTSPDFFYEDPNGVTEGVCIYLDGLSEGIHGNAIRQQDDAYITSSLEDLDYRVIRIPSSHLDDPQAMTVHLRRIARVLVGRERALELVASYEGEHDPGQG